MVDQREAPANGDEPNSPVTRALSRWAFPVTGVLAVIAMAAVFFIAFRDQILGIERWCYRYGRGDVEGEVAPDAPKECRDDERSCELSKASLCRDRRASWVSACIRGDVPAASWNKSACGSR